jgi:hypothetical protein
MFSVSCLTVSYAANILVSVILNDFCYVEVFSVVVCEQVGGVGFLPAPVLALPLVRFWVVGAF